MNVKPEKSKNQVGVAKSLVAEILGTAFLLCTVVGSGIMGEQLSGGNTAIALLANSLATGTALVALILIFAPLSGAHFNPVVTLSTVMNGELSVSRAFAYVVSQITGAFIGVWAAHFMFAQPIIMVSQHIRTGSAQWVSEGIATFGLLAVIHGCKRYSIPVIASAVGAYITAAYWFTSSTSFANPAVTLARSFTDTFSGIRPVDVPQFIISQVVAAILATILFRWLGKEEEL
ncbi:aquaporin family protein [bacterium]|nr:aquaporin family protein [bacterium]